MSTVYSFVHNQMIEATFNRRPNPITYSKMKLTVRYDNSISQRTRSYQLTSYVNYITYRYAGREKCA